MACIAEAGFHSVAQYQWYQEDFLLQNETHPIIYVGERGTYKCVVKVGDRGTKEHSFTVEGIIFLAIILAACTEVSGY